MNDDFYTVIMAGGAGTRFWPASRRAHPKQFLPLGKDPNETLIAATLRRMDALSPVERSIVVTGRALGEATRTALPALPKEHILLEPTGRNTAPCVAWATAWVQRKNPRAVVCVLPADAFIADEAALREALQTAANAAREHGSIVTLGIKPTRPETGYGYLEMGERLGAGVHRVARFVEKPDRARAESFFRGGTHLWNAGIFVFRADVMAAAIEQFLPELSEATKAFDAAATAGKESKEVEARYPTLTNISIDHGVMEKVENVATVPVACGWSDVGSWQAAWELGAKDERENVVRATPAVLIDAKGNHVVAPEGKVVALVGLEDYVVVDTPDALLVMPRSRAQDVKRVVDELANRGQGSHL